MDIQEEKALRLQIVALIPRLRRFALGLTRNGPEADDVVQMALERAMSKIHQFQPGTRLEAWLFRIVRTTWLDDRRRLARRPAESNEDAVNGFAGDSLPQTDTLDLRADLARALGTLTEDQRAVVLLVLVEGQSYDEASEILKVPTGTIMSRLSRARTILMQALSEQGVRP
jgi:RNA polymerase sigma factor (sigma-70 family)